MTRNSGRFTLRLRTQFSFRTNDRTLNRILNGIADANVNSAAFCQTRTNGINSVSVHFVPGSPSSGSARDNRAVRKVLRSFGVRYRENKVIQIVNIAAGVPGVLRDVYGALFRKIKVKVMYDGEDNALIVGVSDVKRASRILSKL